MLELNDGCQIIVFVDCIVMDVLVENGVYVDVKCFDGICGVCKCGLFEGEVEYCDFVFFNK